jgi:hypothetical protein
MGEVILPVAALGLLALSVLLIFVTFYARRSVLTRGIGSFSCSLRAHAGGGAWAHGVARYEHDRLDWFQLFGLSLRPTRSLTRNGLEIIERRSPDGADLTGLLPGWVLVRCAYGARTLEFAMSEPAYSGLATWLESAPPGQHIIVA